MSDEKQSAAQRLAEARGRQVASEPSVELEIERLRNENLKLQLQLTERLADAAKPRDVLAEAQRKEDAIVARLKAEREEFKRKLEEGPRKFWVHLAHQLPVGTTLDHPELLVGAHDEHEARRKYQAALGIISTPHTPAVVEAAEGVPCDSATLIAEAEKGYRPQLV